MEMESPIFNSMGRHQTTMPELWETPGEDKAQSIYLVLGGETGGVESERVVR